ncbi:hypothetical protein J7L87_03020 [bacterium]|nr:hypothetical protein [bacterium]
MGIFAGGSFRVINCKVGDHLAGQLYPRIAERIRDDLEANALFLTDEKEKVLFISCDLVALKREYVKEVIKKIGEKTDIPEENIIICCTHTHAGPMVAIERLDMPLNVEYLGFLKNALVEVSVEAINNSEKVKIGYGKGKAHIGYNRRLCWEDGTHTMYGDSKREEFTGLEGPKDDEHIVLFGEKDKNEIVFVSHNNTCHATCVENALFVSADFPGEARRLIREILGKKIPVLYFQGASGDTSPWDMLHPDRMNREDKERRLKEVGTLLAGETMRIIGNSERKENLTIDTVFEELEVSVRIPSEEEIEEARKVVEDGVEKSGRWDFVLKESVLKLYEEFKDNPFEKLPLHVVRIGELAIATNPCEFYCQFGLDIKRRSPFPITIISQLTNGWSGYCPTIYGYLGGGYSGETIYWTRLEPFAGYKIVDKTCNLLYKLWKRK